MSRKTTRRQFIAVTGTGIVGALAGCTGGSNQQTTDDHSHDDSHETESSGGSGGNAEVEEFLSDTSNYDGIVDKTGQDTVTVTVGAEGNNGNFAFAPPAIRVDAGTTVRWEWKQGSHDVVADDGAFESELVSEGGHTFDHTFEESGTHLYYCTPHKSMGMKGAVVVE